MKLFLFFLMVPFSSFATGWTLNTNFGGAFKSNSVNVYVDGNSACPNNNLTPSDLHDLISEAVDRYWNKVPTSNLRLKAAGFTSGTTNITTGRLCSPTDDACITAGQADPGGLIPAVEDIIISCNTNTNNFGNSDNVLAVTIPNKFSGKKFLGSVIIINDHANPAEFGKLSRRDQIGVIAHEIGHAIGIGHSKESSDLMYYRTVNQRKKLGQGDIDAVSYLYPMKVDLFGLSKNGLLGGACGTISNDDDTKKGPPFLQMVSAFFLVILLFEILKLLKRAKRSSAF